MSNPGTEPTGAPDEERARRARRLAEDRRVLAARRRFERASDRVSSGAVGEVTRRVRDLDIVNHGLILASLVLTLVVPAVITLSALLPLGSRTGLADTLIHRFGMSTAAADDLRSLFPVRQRVSGTTTVLGVIGTLFWALAWPAELARGYESIWCLPNRGLRDSWRSVPWMASFVGVLAVVASSARLAAGTAGAVLAAVIDLPVMFAWCWWSQHLLLAARVTWRTLIPSAVVTALGLVGLGLVMRVYLPDAIVSDFKKYGPIGVIFALFTWFTSFAVVMLGGPLVGHFIATRRTRDSSAQIG